MQASNLTNDERVYYHSPKNEAFRKNPNAKYRYIYYKVHGKKFENDNPNAPIIDYGVFSSRMNGMKTNSMKTRKNRTNKSRKNRKNRKGNTRRS
jgi:hypothetical protein